MCPSPTKGFELESTVLTCFSALFALGLVGVADAGPKRPLTFVVDTRLSEGPAENFTDLAVDPYKLAGLLSPVAQAPVAAPAPAAETTETTEEAASAPAAPQAPTKGDLLIPNERSYSATVAVNGTVIGMLGPYTDGALHNLTAGTYNVSFTHTSGYTYVESIATTQLNSPIVPGGRGAAIALPNQGNAAGE
jgi:hypothetical protein